MDLSFNEAPNMKNTGGREDEETRNVLLRKRRRLNDDRTLAPSAAPFHKRLPHPGVIGNEPTRTVKRKQSPVRITAASQATAAVKEEERMCHQQEHRHGRLVSQIAVSSLPSLSTADTINKGPQPHEADAKTIVPRSLPRRVTLEPSDVEEASNEGESTCRQSAFRTSSSASLTNISESEMGLTSVSRISPAIPAVQSCISEDGLKKTNRVVVVVVVVVKVALDDVPPLKTTTLQPSSSLSGTAKTKVMSPLSLFCKLLLVLGSIFFFQLNILTPATHVHVKPNSVYLPGAGFSGFWYTIGRLEAMIQKNQEAEEEVMKPPCQYYCFSAGCLSAVSMLSPHSTEQIYQEAVRIQNQWKEGTLHQYNVVGQFVDFLLYDDNNVKDHNITGNSSRQQALSSATTTVDDSSIAAATPLRDPHVLSTLHIITTKKKTKPHSFGIEMEIRSPTNVEELHEMLLQTTWIPFVTGNGLWRNGRMDGGLTYLGHPTCDVSATLPLHNLDLLWNSLNVNLGASDVEQFWQSGRSSGLS